MNTQVGITMGAGVLGIALVILLTLLTFRVVAFLLNTLIGHTPRTTRATRRIASGSLLGGFSVLIVAVVLIAGGIFRLRAVRSAPAIPAVVVQTGNAEELIVTNISEARQELQNAIHDPSVEIPLDLPASASPPVAGKEVASNISESAASSEEEPAAVAVKPAAAVLPDSALVPSLETTGVPRSDSVSEPDPIDAPSEPVPPVSTVTSESAATEASDVVSSAPPAPQESVEDRRKRLTELASHLGPLIRSLLQDGDGPEAPVDGNAPAAAESADRKIVVFQLPGPLRKTYAWIQLTPAVEAAVSPVKPLIDNGGLEAMANSLATLLNKPTADKSEIAEAAVKAQPVPEQRDLSAPPLSQVQPEWVTKPDGGRRVAKTAAIFAGEEETAPLLDAINQSLNEHILGVAETLGPAFRSQAGRLQLKLDQTTAQQFVVSSYERHELMETETEGPKPLKFIYALMEFPEAVDKVAVKKIRQAIQTERAVGLGLSVGFAWLAVCCLGCGVRMWSRGSILRRTLALPVFGVMAFPLLLMAAGVLIGLSRGRAIDLPWIETSKSISINVDRDI